MEDIVDFVPEVAVVDNTKEDKPKEPNKTPKVPKTPEAPSKNDVAQNTEPEPAKEKILNLDRNAIRTGQTIEIKKLFFKADSENINAESHEVLDELYDFLQENRDIVIEVGGHTNGTPPHEYCDKLSALRAKSVTDYLTKKGVSEERMIFKGYGKRKPIASNLTALGRKKNQRVEIKILKIG